MRKKTKSKFLPINLNLEGKTILFVGGGDVVFKKVQLFSRRGAKLMVVAPEIALPLKELLAQEGINGTYIEKKFEPEYLFGVDLVYIATSDSAVNQQVAQVAKERNIWFCRGDQSAIEVSMGASSSDFMNMALIESGSVQVAISTGGRSPAVVKALRQQIEEAIDFESIEHYLDLMEALKIRLKSEEEDSKKRAAYLRAASQYTIENLERLLKDEAFYSRFKG